MRRFDDRVVVVTGAASGIGRGLARELAGFTEALRQELAGTRIAVHCVHPGGIRTNILRNARFYADAHGGADHAGANAEFARIARMTPEEAARTIIAGMRRGRPWILIGRDAWASTAYSAGCRCATRGSWVRSSADRRGSATRAPRGGHRRRIRADSTARAPT